LALNFVKGKPVKVVTGGSVHKQADVSNAAVLANPHIGSALDTEALATEGKLQTLAEYALQQKHVALPDNADELAKFLSEKVNASIMAAYATPVHSMALTTKDIQNSIYQALGLQVQEQKPEEEALADQVGVVTEEASSEVLTVVDRYTEIQKMLEHMGAGKLIEEHEALKKSLQSIAKSDQYADDKRVQLHGTHNNYVEFSAKTNKTEITDKPGLINCMGQTTFNELAAVTLTNAKKVIPEAKLSQFTTILPGSRTLKHVNVGN
jgi:hypothetical protein